MGFYSMNIELAEVKVMDFVIVSRLLQQLRVIISRWAENWLLSFLLCVLRLMKETWGLQIMLLRKCWKSFTQNAIWIAMESNIFGTWVWSSQFPKAVVQLAPFAGYYVASYVSDGVCLDKQLIAQGCILPESEIARFMERNFFRYLTFCGIDSSFHLLRTVMISLPVQ